MLGELGLKADEERVYLALLNSGSASVSELCAQPALSNQSESEVSAILDSLVQQMLATEGVGSGSSYIAVDPAIALTDRVARLKARAQRAGELVESLSATHRRQMDRPPETYVEVVSDALRARQHVEDTFRNAQLEVLAMERPPYAERLEEPNPLELDALARGVVHRVLYEQDAVDMPGRAGEILLGVQSGEIARVAARLPLRAIVIDRKVGFLPARRGGLLNDPLLIVHPGTLLDSVIATFEGIWQHAIPVLPGDPDEAPDESERRRLARLLAAGLTDDAIAHQLDLSARTVQRRIAALMDELGARTRFQLGLQAARRGWV